MTDEVATEMRVCAEPGCPNIVEKGRCEAHQRATRTVQRRFYAGTKGISYGRRWRSARVAFLALQPLCVACQAKGYITPATDVDHIEPHRGDYERFWDHTNWQPLCHACHSSKTAAEAWHGGESKC